MCPPSRLSTHRGLSMSRRRVPRTKFPRSRLPLAELLGARARVEGQITNRELAFGDLRGGEPLQALTLLHCSRRKTSVAEGARGSSRVVSFCKYPFASFAGSHCASVK